MRYLNAELIWIRLASREQCPWAHIPSKESSLYPKKALQSWSGLGYSSDLEPLPSESPRQKVMVTMVTQITTPIHPNTCTTCVLPRPSK